MDSCLDKESSSPYVLNKKNEIEYEQKRFLYTSVQSLFILFYIIVNLEIFLE